MTGWGLGVWPSILEFLRPRWACQSTVARMLKRQEDFQSPMVDIVTTEGVLGGKPRLAGRRISVLQVAEMILDGGMTAEDVADQLDLSLAEIHTTLAYYYEHPTEMETLREQRVKAEEPLRDIALSPDRVEQ